MQVRKIIWKLFELMPTPEAGMHADEEAVRELIQPLGLAPKRAPMLIRFCKDYVEKQVRSAGWSLPHIPACCKLLHRLHEGMNYAMPRHLVCHHVRCFTEVFDPSCSPCRKLPTDAGWF